MTVRAHRAIQEAEVVVGYKTYLELIGKLLAGKEVHRSGMREEIERCRLAIGKALEGHRVAVISGGDPGVYGLAGPVLELLALEPPGQPNLEVEIISGVTAATAAASSLGAPLMHDFAVISLSDLLAPWEVIEERLEAAARADFVTVLYNPRSHGRTEQIARAREIFIQYRGWAAPVGIIRNCQRQGEETVITDLGGMLDHPIDMLTTVIIGNSRTYVQGGYLITPRGYRL